MGWLFNPVAIINSIPYVAIVLLLSIAYNVMWENPRIRSEARSGYVLEVSAVAAKAELDERNRQAQAAIVAAGNLSRTLEKQKADDAAALEAQKKDLKDYAASLKAQKRSCPLTDDDIRWLRK